MILVCSKLGSTEFVFSVNKFKKELCECECKDIKAKRSSIDQGMKDAEKKLNAKPTATPVVYFKDFEKRFDELLVKNKTPR